MENTDNINDLLINVRKAYRLLYQYQRKIMDLAGFIGNQYGFSFYGGYPRFSNHPRKGKQVSLAHNWAWDWLGMYFYEFCFNTETIDNKEINFTIFLQSDTGFFDKNLEDHQKLEIKEFEKVEKSESYIHLLVAYKKWNNISSEEWTWESYFKQGLNKVESGENDKNYKYDCGGNLEEGIILVYKFPLSDMNNEANTKSCLNKFTEYCRTFGIDLKPITNN